MRGRNGDDTLSQAVSRQRCKSSRSQVGEGGVQREASVHAGRTYGFEEAATDAVGILTRYGC
jgi:hypothetical protein